MKKKRLMIKVWKWKSNGRGKKCSKTTKNRVGSYTRNWIRMCEEKEEGKE